VIFKIHNIRFYYPISIIIVTVYQLHIMSCDAIVASTLKKVND